MAYSFVDCEAEFSSSLDYSISSSGFSFTSMDRSGGSEDVIVVTEEGVKEVEKPHTEVSPAYLYVGIYVHRIKGIL